MKQEILNLFYYGSETVSFLGLKIWELLTKKIQD